MPWEKKKETISGGRRSRKQDFRRRDGQEIADRTLMRRWADE